MELCLGTVQFGMDYGINGKQKPDLSTSLKCLDFATQNGIRAIDTATAYGTAEEIVGIFLRKKTVSRSNIYLSNKLTPNSLDDCTPEKYKEVIHDNLKKSLVTLGTDYVDAYLFHSARYAYNDAMIEALSSVVDEGLARNVGVSIYEPDEAMACLRNDKISFIQAPYSIFDHRIKDAGVLETISKKQCTLHTRSAFLQGLVLMAECQIPHFLSKARPFVKRMDEICKALGISRTELALAYVKRETAISNLVFGVHSLEQLIQDIRYFQNDTSMDIFDYVDGVFSDVDAEIVIPSLWKKDKQ